MALIGLGLLTIGLQYALYPAGELGSKGDAKAVLVLYVDPVWVNVDGSTLQYMSAMSEDASGRSAYVLDVFCGLPLHERRPFAMHEGRAELQE